MGRGNKIEENYIIGCNNNILINSNFANPVNQRGNASIINSDETGSAYWIDRWKYNKNVGRTELRVSDGYVSVTQAAAEKSYCYLTQIVEFPNTYSGKKIALSCKYRATKGGSANIVPTISGGKSVVFQLICDGEWHIFEKVIEVPSVQLTAFSPIEFVIGNITGSEYDWSITTVGDLSVDTTLDIEWAKAEVSDFCTPYVPRLYAEELQLCKRYYEEGYGYIHGNAQTNTSYKQYYTDMVRWNVAKRVNPTVTVTNLSGNNIMEEVPRIDSTYTDLKLFCCFFVSPQVVGEVSCKFKYIADAEL